MDQFEISVKLNVLPLGSYDMLIGMDWLKQHRVVTSTTTPKTLRITMYPPIYEPICYFYPWTILNKRWKDFLPASMLLLYPA